MVLGFEILDLLILSSFVGVVGRRFKEVRLSSD